MRIAFVVQRYGLEVNGGAEMEARLVAEHVAPYLQVEVLTSCAVDYMTWENFYPPGAERVNGIVVRRFAVRQPRDVPSFNLLSAHVLSNPHTFYEEIEWMRQQGPDVPGLFDFIRQQHNQYDLFLFFTYLYATTFVGMQIVPFKSILFPTAHEESWIHLGIFRTPFHLPRAFIFNSEEEEHFVRTLFHNDHIPGAVLGVGIEIPPVPQVDVLDQDYVLYLGRVDESKGCKDLFEFFLHYKTATRDPIKLVLIGQSVMPVPSHPDIIALGYMKEERFAWLERAQSLILPSSQESLSLSTLEAWMMQVPVLVNGKSVVLKGHCLRSQGGLCYDNETEFVAALHQLRADPRLRSTLGQRGKAYVQRQYNWEGITNAYVRFFRRVYDMVNAKDNSSL
jgi:glycosyltransferase involved in cell wall biosynthesis